MCQWTTVMCFGYVQSEVEDLFVFVKLAYVNKWSFFTYDVVINT